MPASSWSATMVRASTPGRTGRQAGEVAGVQARPGQREGAGGGEARLDALAHEQAVGERLVVPQADHAALLLVAGEVEARLGDVGLAGAVRPDPREVQRL